MRILLVPWSFVAKVGVVIRPVIIMHKHVNEWWAGQKKLICMQSHRIQSEWHPQQQVPFHWPRWSFILWPRPLVTVVFFIHVPPLVSSQGPSWAFPSWLRPLATVIDLSGVSPSGPIFCIPPLCLSHWPLGQFRSVFDLCLVLDSNQVQGVPGLFTGSC